MKNKLIMLILLLIVFLTIIESILFYDVKKNHNEINSIKEEIKILEFENVTEDPVLLHLKSECEKYDVDFIQMLGLIFVESRFKIKAISYLGINYGYGLMQVSKVCLKDYNLWNGTNYTQKDLGNPYINITIGMWVYNQNRKYTRTNDVDTLLSAYNIGARKTRENGLNYSYINKVKNAKEFLIIEDIKIN